MRLFHKTKPVLIVSALLGLVAWSGALMLVFDLGRMSTQW